MYDTKMNENANKNTKKIVEKTNDENYKTRETENMYSYETHKGWIMLDVWVEFCTWWPVDKYNTYHTFRELVCDDNDENADNNK